MSSAIMGRIIEWMRLLLFSSLLPVVRLPFVSPVHVCIISPFGARVPRLQRPQWANVFGVAADSYMLGHKFNNPNCSPSRQRM